MATDQDIIAFRSRFPALIGLVDADISAALDTADISLDVNMWARLTDFNLARQYLAAHWLQLQILYASSASEAGGIGAADVFVRQISMGERRIAFQQRQAFTKAETALGPGEQLYDTTIYGQRFLELRWRNLPLVAVV